MLTADIVDDVSRTVMTTLDDADLDALEAVFAEAESAAAASLAAQAIPAGQAVLERAMEVRYLGQEHSLTVPVGRDLRPDAVRAAFEELHHARYGHVMDNRLQILNLRVRGIGRIDKPELPAYEPGDGDPARARIGSRDAFDFGAREVTSFAVYDRAKLEPGDVLDGPALIDEGTSTTVVHSGQRVQVNPFGHLLVTLTPEVRS
jgi:N-methylhydantoinase A